MQAVEDGLIKTELTDETKETLREFENYYLEISVLLYCFPDDFDLPFKFCHRLLWSDEWEYGGDITSAYTTSTTLRKMTIPRVLTDAMP